jgi:3-deoxy-manno-octulosonate cytidylyltransferase (CMP-KDO synthetase)
MGAIGLIPARLESSRLPGKLLLAETGLPLLQYAWEAATRSESLDEVIVATDSDEVAATVRAFGGRCEMTGQAASGTDRIAEVVRNCGLDAEIVVNIQGDEPEIEPETIDSLVETLANAPAAQMSTLSTPIQTAEDRDDPSCVKVVCAADGRALYFSRSVIPHVRDAESPSDMADSPWQLHLGLYAYRRDFLLRLAELPPSRLEQLEKLEQLRALEAGACIQVATIEHPSVGIDTPEDYAQFIKRQRRRAA